jgi:hypothetical protein
MAGRNRPSFLKKQKEEQRRARATMKREARLARRRAATTKDAGSEAPVETREPIPGGENGEPGGP